MIKPLIWKVGFVALACYSEAVRALQQYQLVDDYSVNFFDKFEFFTAPDPTNGFVKYVDKTTARNTGLIDDSRSAVKLGVDHTNIISSGGRPSVRIQSVTKYNKGLFIVDINHMPGGICGTWPAFWMNGPHWPDTGEIDIIEGVHLQTKNKIALHTSNNPPCSVKGFLQTSTQETYNCYTYAPDQSNNAGCATNDNIANTYGTGFNNVGGGVYATQWTSKGIQIWFFPRTAIPADITVGKPNPSGWGTPNANFEGPCDFNSHFSDMQIIFDTTFCGDWAGNVWGNSGCSSPTYPTCNRFVGDNPSAFTDAYWEVNSLKVYQLKPVVRNFLPRGYGTM